MSVTPLVSGARERDAKVANWAITTAARACPAFTRNPRRCGDRPGFRLHLYESIPATKEAVFVS